MEDRPRPPSLLGWLLQHTEFSSTRVKPGYLEVDSVSSASCLPSQTVSSVGSEGSSGILKGSKLTQPNVQLTSMRRDKSRRPSVGAPR